MNYWTQPFWLNPYDGRIKQEVVTNAHYIHEEIKDKFLPTYYAFIMEHGFNSIINLFASDCKCTLDGQEFSGSENLRNKFATLKAKRLIYRNIKSTSQAVNDTTILITASGTITPLFEHLYGGDIKFTETFVLKNTNSIFVVSNYILASNT